MRVAFAVFGVSEGTLARTEFYNQDFEILKGLGHEVELVGSPWGLVRRFDVAFVWWWNYLWLWGPAAKALALPVLTTGVYDLAVDEAWPAWKRRLKRWGVGYSDLHAFVSQDEARSVASALSLPKESVRYCPLAVDTEVYRPTATPPGLPFTILNVAWQEKSNLRRKMIFELLEAFAALRRQLPDVRLILAGPPADGTSDLRAAAAGHGVTDLVSFPGELTREEKIRLMRECSLYCQVSRFEGFGLAIAEAMACGAAVLVSSEGAIPEAVGDCGVYVRELTAEGIADALHSCATSPALLAELRQKAPLRIQSSFSRERRGRALGVWLDEVVHLRRSRAGRVGPPGQSGGDVG